ncbi:unnamed protein product [Caenorhabditis sp. 36 PRJEB53466]|nr:unnamed protein product [Caenorhabditis sp. 36 PRJEB53466]
MDPPAEPECSEMTNIGNFPGPHRYASFLRTSTRFNAFQEKLSMLMLNDDLGRIIEEKSFNKISVRGDELVPQNILLKGIAKIGDRKAVMFVQNVGYCNYLDSRKHAFIIGELLKLATKLKIPIIGITDYGPAYGFPTIFTHANSEPMLKAKYDGQAQVPFMWLHIGNPTNLTIPSIVADFIFTAGSINGPILFNQRVSHGFFMHHLAALGFMRALFSYIPNNNLKPAILYYFPPNQQPEPTDIPERDMIPFIESMADYNAFIPLMIQHSPQLLVGFIRLEGRVVGVLSKNWIGFSLSLDHDMSIKGSQFIRYCNTFQVPLMVILEKPFSTAEMNITMNFLSDLVEPTTNMLNCFKQATTLKLTLLLSGQCDYNVSTELLGKRVLCWSHETELRPKIQTFLKATGGTLIQVTRQETLSKVMHYFSN